MVGRAPLLPRRKASIRYPGYDYSGPGAYFVTVCTQDRRPLFGHVRDNEMHGNDISAMVEEVWHDLPRRYPGLSLDAKIVMPDHVHGILFLGADPDIDTLPRLGDVVSYFKGQSSIRYFDQVRRGPWPPVHRRLWQQKYFDRIVRSERELENIRWYIETNPVRWWGRRGDV
jgi:REP element-mobilizing transposase RayT